MSTDSVSPLRQRMIEDMNSRQLSAGVDGCQDPRKDGGAKKPGTTFAGFGRAFPSSAWWLTAAG